MGERSRVIIEQGSMLYLNGGTLTNTTNDESEFWNGIEIVGNNNKITNSTFEIDETSFLSNYNNLTFGVFKSDNDANVNFSSWGVITSTSRVTGPTTGFSGGYFYIKNTNFYNNLYTSIYIQTANGVNDLDLDGYSIVGCKFSSNLYNYHPSLDFYGQIFSDGGIPLLKVYNCEFEATNMSKNRINGVNSNSAFLVASNCDFSGFKSTIAIRNTNILSKSLRHSLISSCSINYPYNTPYPCIHIQNSDGTSIVNNNIVCENNFNGQPNPVISINGSDGFKLGDNIISFQNYNSNNVSNALYIRNAAPFYSLMWRNTISNMDYVIFAEGKNDGFKFTCNNFLSTKQFDLKIYSGNISPMQGTILYPAENKFKVSPDLPISRFNLNTNNNAKSFNYWYNLNDPITKPFTLTLPQISISGSNNSQHQYYNCCVICLVKPPVDKNAVGYDEDLNNSFDSLKLTLNERKAISRDFDIMNLEYSINRFVDSNKIDSAIYLVNRDSTFYGLYFYSKLLLMKDSINLANKMVKDFPINDDFEINYYKILFPILTDGILHSNDSSWFARSLDSLVSLSNKVGFIADQAKSILDYYNRNSRILSELNGYELECDVFPIPFSNTLTIDIKSISSAIDSIDMQIIDKYGNELIFKETGIGDLFPQSININTETLPIGIYLVLLKYRGSILRFKYVLKS